MSLKQVCALSFMGLLTATVAGVAGDVLQVTPLQALGPYYPVIKPTDQDGDLTVIKGKKRSAEGQILYIVGRVLNKEGKPVSGARVEIWQTNAQGRYNHPSDTNEAPLDPYFQGYGVVATDADGGFRFKTVKPAAYPAGTMKRPPHVHFQVTGRYDRLVTQMYFPGEPLNNKDPLFNEAGVERDALIARIVSPMKGMERDAIVAVWDIVLHKG